jgi:hypothetical protein
LLVEAGQEFDQASKPEKFIRQCGRRHPSNFIVTTKKRDAQNGVLQVNGGREFLPSLVGQITCELNAHLRKLQALERSPA